MPACRERSGTVSTSPFGMPRAPPRGKEPASVPIPFRFSSLRTQSTTTGTDSNAIETLAEILGLTAREPGSMDDANELLYAIEDAATKALFARHEPSDGAHTPAVATSSRQATPAPETTGRLDFPAALSLQLISMENKTTSPADTPWIAEPSDGFY